MSRTSLPNNLKNREAARGPQLYRLLFYACAILLAVSAITYASFTQPPQRNRNLQVERIPPLQNSRQQENPRKISVRLSASKKSVSSCPDKASDAWVQLKASVSGLDGRAARYDWHATGGNMNGDGASANWDLSGVKPGTYTASLTLNSSSPAVAPIRIASDDINVNVGVCQESVLACPAIRVECPETVNAGQRLPFRAIVTRKEGSPRVEERPSWSVSSDNGKPLTTQGASDRLTKVVSTTGLGGQTITATFQLTGYDQPCVAACKSFVTPQSTPPTPTPTPTPQGNNNAPVGTITPIPPTPTPSPSASTSPTPSASPSPTASPTPNSSPTPFTSPSSSPTESPIIVNDPGGIPPTDSRGAWIVSYRWPGFLLAALIVGALLFAKFYSRSALKGMPLPSPSPPPPQPESSDREEMEAAIAGGLKKVTDELHCTVFAPFAAAPGMGFIVQAFAHLAEQTTALAEMAKETDREATRRGFKRLGEVERGQELGFHLEMPGLNIDEPSQSIVWRGEIESVQFGVVVPAEFPLRARINCKLTVSLYSVPLGHIRFAFDIAPTLAAAEPEGDATPLNSFDSLVKYRQAFISYASEDRAEVLKRVQMLSILKIEYFQDLLSLKPGDRWAKMLYRHIDESDVFLLFWSAAANESEWVAKEVQYALQRKSGNDESPPEIIPVILQGPPEVPPPSYLPEYHFNDPFAYFIKAEVAMRQTKKET